MKDQFKNLIPHRAPMVLLDELVCEDKVDFTTQVNITLKSFLSTSEGVPSWVGIEYMAQTISAYSGVHIVKGTPSIGFLVSVRNYKVNTPNFKLNSKLQIKVTPTLIDEKSGCFHCKIYIQAEEIASAVLTTYKPDQTQLNLMKEFF